MQSVSGCIETWQHFIAGSSAYNLERETYAEKLRNNPVFSDELVCDVLNPELFTQHSLDASFYTIMIQWTGKFRDPRITFKEIHLTGTQEKNSVSKLLCFRLRTIASILYKLREGHCVYVINRKTVHDSTSLRL